MGLPRRIAKPAQLLVEGKDQENFFRALCSEGGLEDRLQIQDFGGVSELRRFLRGFVMMPEFEKVRSIGVIRDAEKAAGPARRSVEDSLRAAGLPTPGEDCAGLPAVRVLILPDGERPGMLETLLNDSVSDSPVKGCIDDFFRCAGALPGIDIRMPDKARALAYLATRPRPQHSVGVAAQMGDWPLGHPAFDSVRAFVAAL